MDVYGRKPGGVRKIQNDQLNDPGVAQYVAIPPHVEMHKNHRAPLRTIQEEDEERAAAEFLALVRESSQGFAAVMIDKAVLPMCQCVIPILSVWLKK